MAVCAKIIFKICAEAARGCCEERGNCSMEEQLVAKRRRAAVVQRGGKK